MPTFLLLLLVVSATREVREPGFRIAVPSDWKVRDFGQGYVAAGSPDGGRFVFLRPVLGRTNDCGATLRAAFQTAWPAFPGARNVVVSAAGPRMHVARFGFGDGKLRGQVLCVETSARTAMYYGLAAPQTAFAAEVTSLTNILRSFQYEGAPKAAQTGSPPRMPLPRMVAWREPNEQAYIIQVPEGWRVVGGLQRHDVTHAISGVEVSNPAGDSVLRFGDPRLTTCTIPGPGFAAMSGGNNGGLKLCGYQTGGQAGDTYVRQTLAREWSIDQLKILSIEDRPDWAANADRLPKQFGLNVRTSVALIHFEGRRRGSSFEGWATATTQFTAAVQGQNFIAGTLSVNIGGFGGPPARIADLAAISGHTNATWRWSLEWWQREQRISRQVADSTLATLRSAAESQQRSFEERMNASDRRREAVNDVLGGTVRLNDGQGNTYQTRAGSNYYFVDLNQERQTGARNAVVGTDVYPGTLVDLRPLEIIK